MKHEIRTADGKTEAVDLTALKAIRRFCAECMGFQSTLIRGCADTLCCLYPYRMGRNPARAGLGGDIVKARRGKVKKQALGQ